MINLTMGPLEMSHQEKIVKDQDHLVAADLGLQKENPQETGPNPVQDQALVIIAADQDQGKWNFHS